MNRFYWDFWEVCKCRVKLMHDNRHLQNVFFLILFVWQRPKCVKKFAWFDIFDVFATLLTRFPDFKSGNFSPFLSLSHSLLFLCFWLSYSSSLFLYFRHSLLFYLPLPLPLFISLYLSLYILFISLFLFFITFSLSLIFFLSRSPSPLKMIDYI